MAGMTRQEMKMLVNRYIGVSGGYLGDFSYRTHENFYPEFCVLDIDPGQYQGTTRARFEAILEAACPVVQAAIIRGILRKYPPSESNPQRNRQAHDEYLNIAIRLESSGAVDGPPTAISSAIVQHAIADAEALIKTRGATSGVDRVHTMLHGYMRAVCDDATIAYTKEMTIGALFKAIREQHSAFAGAGPRPQDIVQIIRSFGAIMDVLNPIRNNASAAHANNDLLPEPEAMLVINATKTVLHYLDAKLAGK